MKKVIPLMIVATMMCAGLAQAEKVKLSVFAQIDAGTAGHETFKVIVQEFQKKHPDIELEIERLQHDAYHEKLQAMTIAGQIPDVVHLWPGKRTGQTTETGLVQDLRPWIEKSGIADRFIELAMTPQGPNGEIWELPSYVTGTHVLYTNTKLLKDLGLSFPANLAEMLEQDTIIREAGLFSIAMGNSGQWPMQSCLTSTLVERTGGVDWFQKAKVGDGAAFTDPEFVAALNVIKTLADEGVFMPGLNQIDRTQAQEMFVAEKVVYLIEGTWRTGDLINVLSDEQKEYVSLEVFPELPGQKGLDGSMSAVPGIGFGMNAELSGEKAEAAWKWISFWAGEGGAEHFLRIQGVVPAYKITPPEDIDMMMKKLLAFTAGHPSTFVIDNEMDAEGMGVLNPGLQELTMGEKTAEQLAEEYEVWVDDNDSNRE